jgi:hypothetical protein
VTEDQTTEQAIVAAGANVAPRVTPADIEMNIASEHYFTAADGVIGAFAIERARDSNSGVSLPSLASHPVLLQDSMNLLTICVLVLRNGFTVTGESACASPENFNAEIGRKVARQNAISKVWPLMGYALKEKMAG